MNENHTGDNEAGHALISVTVQMEPPNPPPPPGFTSPFKSVEEWLFCLCDTDKPEKTIAELQLCLMESPAVHVLSIEGFNKHHVKNDVIGYCIDFKPSHMFFPLSQEEYKNLSPQQMRERVLKQLKAFISTAEFQRSWMSKVNSIKINYVDGSWQKLK